MSFAIAIFGMIAAWATVAGAMLWGVLRVARRRHTSVGDRDRESQASVASASSVEEPALLGKYLEGQSI